MDMKYKYQQTSQGRSENYERMDRRVRWLTIVVTLLTIVAVASLAMSVYVGYEMLFGRTGFSNCSDSNSSLLQHHQQEMQKMREQLQVLNQMVTTLKETSSSGDKNPSQSGPGKDSGVLRQGATGNAEFPRVGPPVVDVTVQEQQMDGVSLSTTAPHDQSHEHHHQPHSHHHTESSASHQHHHTESSVPHPHQHHHHHHHQHHHGGAVPVDESSGDGMGDDEDSTEDFEFGSGEGECPPFPKPYCPVGRRVCLTKERCPRPVCC